MVAIAGSFQKLQRLNQHKQRELTRVQAFLSDWSKDEFADEKLVASSLRHRVRILSNEGEKVLLASDELGLMVSLGPGLMPGVLDAELVSLNFWRGDPLLSPWKVISIEIFRRHRGGHRNDATK
jgi:hypothetical protein